MANPNIVNVSDIKGKSATANVLTSDADTVIVINTLASDKIFKINALYLSNIDSANDATANISIERSSVDFSVLKTVLVPYASSLDVVNKAFYLEEGDALKVAGDANNKLQVVCSYEEIS